MNSLPKKRNNLSSNLKSLENYLFIKPRTQKEIADHFAVDRKTVKRAIDKLSFNSIISEEKDGRHVRYSISEINFKAEGLTPLELASLVLSRETICAGGNLSFGSPFAEAGKTLVEKVRRELPPEIRRNLDELTNVLGTAAVPNKDYTNFEDVIEEITAAAIQKRVILMTYSALSSGQKSERLFAPYNIYLDPDGATLKTIGFDYRNLRISPFSIDRILKIKITKDLFIRPKDFRLSQFLEENCFNGIHGTPILVKLKASGTTAQIFAERKFHFSQKTVAVKKSQEKGLEEIEIEMRVAEGRGLERFILSWLPEIEVMAPKTLKEKIKQIVADYNR